MNYITKKGQGTMFYDENYDFDCKCRNCEFQRKKAKESVQV